MIWFHMHLIRLGNIMQTSLEHTTDTEMTAAELLAQTTQVDQAWNQQDPLKIAQDLNAIIQNMMHSGDEA